MLLSVLIWLPVLGGAGLLLLSLFNDCPHRQKSFALLIAALAFVLSLPLLFFNLVPKRCLGTQVCETPFRIECLLININAFLSFGIAQQRCAGIAFPNSVWERVVNGGRSPLGEWKRVVNCETPFRFKCRLDSRLHRNDERKTNDS